MWVFLLGGDFINLMHLKKIFKNLLSERTSTAIGNLAYLSILSIGPALIILLSLISVFSKYTTLNNIPSIEKIYAISQTLSLNKTTNFLINLLCINLLSSGIFCLLSIFEKIYGYKFQNYIKKKLYSLALALIFLLSVIIIIAMSFLISKNIFLKKIDFLINLTLIFISILLLYKLTTFQKLKKLYSGALISSFILTIFLNFFYYIINNFSNIKSYYGLLAPIIISVLLIYYSCYIIYFGVLLNIEFAKIKWIFIKK